MKYLNLYEDIKWDFDDEELDINYFNIGDKVELVDSKRVMFNFKNYDYQSTGWDIGSTFLVKDIKDGGKYFRCIPISASQNGHPYNNHNLIPFGNTWYLSKNFKHIDINESIKWEFDDDEDDERNKLFVFSSGKHYYCGEIKLDNDDLYIKLIGDDDLDYNWETFDNVNGILIELIKNNLIFLRDSGFNDRTKKLFYKDLIKEWDIIILGENILMADIKDNPKYYITNESIKWEFEYEDENEDEIIGNIHFTEFLKGSRSPSGKSLYDKFIESIKICNHDSIRINTISDINNYIKSKCGNRNSLRGVIDYTIYFNCAIRNFNINWSIYNSEWNDLCDNDESIRAFRV